jgi:hypothetical protein
MDLVDKFQLAAEACNVQMSGGMEVNKSYAIVFCDRSFHPTFGFMFTLILGVLGSAIAVCPMPLLYSYAFTEQDVSDINANPTKYHLFDRKRENMDEYYFEIVK